MELRGSVRKGPGAGQPRGTGSHRRLRAKGKFQLHNRSIDVHISTLRRKLGDQAEEPRYIRTVRSIGYMLIATQLPPS